MYLLDTCIISKFIRGDVKIIDAFHLLKPYEIHISAITLFEVEFGLLKNPGGVSKFMPIIAELFLKSQMLDISYKESISAAHIRSDLNKLGNIMGHYDILIAATALANDLILVTSDIQKFSKIKSLKCEAW